MRKIEIINANTDLGVMVDGTKLGPDVLTENLNEENILKVNKVYAKDVVKEKDKGNLKRNLESLNEFNERLYKQVLEVIDNGHFPFTLGGDHSMAIASAFASIKRNGPLGIIWVDAHGDYNTFDTTVSGNIHGLPLAVLDGYEKRDIVGFHDGMTYSPKNTVIVGGRDIESLEIENLKDAGVTIFSTEEVHERGMKAVMEEAIKIACNGTSGMHISYDLDVIDPVFCPGVSVPAVDGITIEEAYDVLEPIIAHKDELKSLDLVEYNPLRDKEDITKNIALKIIRELARNI